MARDNEEKKERRQNGRSVTICPVIRICPQTLCLSFSPHWRGRLRNTGGGEHNACCYAAWAW